jgi:hypothetical protein
MSISILDGEWAHRASRAQPRPSNEPWPALAFSRYLNLFALVKINELSIRNRGTIVGAIFQNS